MNQAKNKVKFNIKNVHYAKLTEGEDGTFTWAEPVAIPGAVSISLDASGEVKPFYADGIVYYQSASNSGYEGDLEMALIPDSFREEILGDRKDNKGVMIEDANVEVVRFALLFEFDGDAKAIRHCMYNCTASRPSISGETTEATKTPGTESVSITSNPLPDGRVKAKTGEGTDDLVYQNWYKSVYIEEKAE